MPSKFPRSLLIEPIPPPISPQLEEVWCDNNDAKNDAHFNSYLKKSKSHLLAGRHDSQNDSMY